jgi:hypothetical protein
MRQPPVKPDDICRLIHFVHDPSNQGLLTAAYQPLSRVELDRPSCDRRDPWIEIAARYNDYEAYRYTNATVDPGLADETPRSAPGMDVAFRSCGTWNPTNGSRPARDAGWIRTQLSNLRKDYTKIRDKFHASGNQDAEYKVDEFNKFCGGLLYPLYAFVVWQDTRVQWFWDRRLPTEFQREEGAEDSDSESIERPDPQPPTTLGTSGKRRRSLGAATPAKRSRENAVSPAPAQEQVAVAMAAYFESQAKLLEEKRAAEAFKAEVDTLTTVSSSGSLPEDMKEEVHQRLRVLLQLKGNKP